MNVNEVNIALARGAADSPGVLPHWERLSAQPFVFSFDFGLEALPREPGILIVRGPRQYGKSTWLEGALRETIREFGPGSAFYVNGDEIPHADALAVAIRGLLGMFDPSRKVRRLFVDEVTAVADWQRALKGLADAGELRDVLVVTTGSRVADLRRGAERLPGRKGRLPRTEFRFTPLSFAEFDKVCGKRLGKSLLPAYIVSGGSPPACSELAASGAIPAYLREAVRDWILGECAASGRSRISLLAVMEALHRFGGTPVGQAKLSREAGLANNTVAAGYVEMLMDLQCAAPAFAWDTARRVGIARKPCKYHFTNLLAAGCWSPDRPRSAADYPAFPPETQGKWLGWTVAQEIHRRRCIRGEEIPELLFFWQGKEHELDFVLEPDLFVEVKRGRTSPLEFQWFEHSFPLGRLLVIGEDRFRARAVRGITLEDFLRGDDGA